MARELTIFISSTVEGLRPVRDEIAELLAARGIVVRKSDDPGFPIEAGVTSHDACLRAMEGVHVCILLIGTRFGGEYGDARSITWMEYEAAREVGAYPIVLIHKQMNDLAIAISRERSKLAKKFPAATDVDLDARLRKLKEFVDWKPTIDNLPAQQRFIDAVRKGHVDNWVHNDWTGTTRDAMRWIDARLGTLLASTIDKFGDLHQTTSGVLRLNDMLTLLVRSVFDGTRTRVDAAQALLVLAESLRTQLFGFAENDRYNMALFARDPRNVYRAVARRSHAAIRRHDREWALGDGQVGTAAAMDEPLVTPDLTLSSMRTTDPALREQDETYYRSVVSVPLLVQGGKADLVFIVSTDRRGHFRAKRQPEVLTAVAVGHIFGTLWLVGGHIEQEHS
jgi:hypothetical protein